jgi:hypothetical protein
MAEVPSLKVVGSIAPPGYKDPVHMLRKIADDIEAGEHGDIDTIVVATFGTDGLDTYGGGRDSDMFHCAYVFGAAHNRLLNLSNGDING